MAGGTLANSPGVFMEKKSRRGLLTKGATVAAAAAAGAALLGSGAQAQSKSQPKLEKRSPYPPPNPPPAGPPMFSRAVAYGNMLFLSGVGAHYKGTIEEHTRTVLDELSKNLADAGSSLQKCLKVNVYLNDLADYNAMNAVYRSYNWGSIPPVRTTVAPATGIPGGSLIEIDLIAYI
jgi:enamine deaminase RidA (YjgF/YER057c/UK114 family)